MKAFFDSWFFEKPVRAFFAVAIVYIIIIGLLCIASVIAIAVIRYIGGYNG